MQIQFAAGRVEKFPNTGLLQPRVPLNLIQFDYALLALAGHYPACTDNTHSVFGFLHLWVDDKT